MQSASGSRLSIEIFTTASIVAAFRRIGTPIRRAGVDAAGQRSKWQKALSVLAARRLQNCSARKRE
jgi:hypothetical protein